MSAGRIIETGPARDLFLSPKTEFGARFFGAGLVLDCSILGHDPAGILIDSPLGKLLVPNTAPADSPACNPERPLLFVPRDALSILTITTDYQGRTCEAIYRNSGFAGDRITLELELSGGISCTVETGPRTKLPPRDSPVTLGIDERLIRFVG
jgi:ABC-type Fe3+/spermidine/putrescine transport system ATPase subunit